jgi:hypothetical protein
MPRHRREQPNYLPSFPITHGANTCRRIAIAIAYLGQPPRISGRIRSTQSPNYSRAT